MVIKTERYITAKHHMMNYCFAWAYLFVLRVGCDIPKSCAHYRGGFRYQTGQQAKGKGKEGVGKQDIMFRLFLVLTFKMCSFL